MKRDTRVICNLCNGSGKEYGTTEPCLRCFGTGHLIRRSDGAHVREAPRSPR